MKCKSPDEVKEEYVKAFPSETGGLAYYLSNQITYLHVKWKEYREIYGEDPETIDLVNEVAPYFFWMLERVLRHDVISSISRLLDPAYSGRGTNRPNASFEKLIDDLKDHVEESLIKEWENDLKELKQASKEVLKIRNKVLSHKDFEVHVTYSPEILSGISRKNVEDLLKLTRSLANKIQLHFKGAQTAYEYVAPPIEGTKSLLAFIESNLKD